MLLDVVLVLAVIGILFSMSYGDFVYFQQSLNIKNRVLRSIAAFFAALFELFSDIFVLTKN